MGARQALHALVDELPDDELAAAKRFLEYLRQQDAYKDQITFHSAPWSPCLSATTAASRGAERLTG